MRRLSVIILLCINILVACGVQNVDKQSSSTGTQSIDQTITPDLIPMTPTITTSPTPVLTDSSIDIPTRLPLPTTEIVDLDAFITTTIERYPLELPGSYVAAWSPDDKHILYVQSTSVTINGIGYPREIIALFDLQTHQIQILAEDAVGTDFHPQLRPVWDHEHNRILYARVNTDANPKTNDTPGITATIDLVALDPTGGEQLVFDTNIPLYDATLGSMGRAGIFKQRELKNVGFNKSDTLITMPVILTEQLGQDPRELYHRLWVAPDNIHYAVAISHSLQVYQTGQVTPLQTYDFPPPAVVHQLIWSPDSTAIYYRRWEPQPPFEFYGAYVHRITSTMPKPLEQGLTGGVAWSLDSRWLSVGIPASAQCVGSRSGCNDQLKIIDPFGIQSQTLLDGFIGIAEQSAWSSNGTRIASVCYHQKTLKSPEIGELCILNIKEQR